MSRTFITSQRNLANNNNNANNNIANNNNMKNNKKMEKRAVFLKAPKTMNMFIYNTPLLIIGIKDISGFSTPASLLGWFSACIVIGCFRNFLVNPYYKLATTLVHDEQDAVDHVKNFY